MFSFARKTRQLNYRIKQLKKLATYNPLNYKIEAIKNQILQLKNALPKIHINTYKALFALGLIGIYTPKTSAQSLYAPPVEQQFNLLEQHNSGEKVITRYLFVDIDNDGDQDCFYEEYDLEQFNDPFNIDVHKTITFQENISDGVIKYAPPIAVIDFFIFEDPFIAWNVADLDNDGDWDVYGAISNYSQTNCDTCNYNYDASILVYENTSSVHNSFEIADSIIDTISMTLLTNVPQNAIKEFKTCDLDNDGDNDILALINGPNYQYGESECIFMYLENNGSNSILPFETAVLEPFNLDAVANTILTNDISPSIFTPYFKLIDIDSDLDKDLVYEQMKYNYYYTQDSIEFSLIYFENLGTANSASFSAEAKNLFDSHKVNPNADLDGTEVGSLTLADLDQDGDLDIMQNGVFFNYNYDSINYYQVTQFSNQLFFVENISNEATLIEGKVFIDENSNSVLDINESPINGQSIIIEPNSFIINTNNEGIFKTFLGNGDYTITIESPEAWSAVPEDYSISLGVDPDTISNLNFALQPQSLQQDLRIDAIGFTTRRGFDTNYKIKYSNLGTTTENGRIIAQFDEDLDIISSDPNATSINDSTLEWTFANLAPFENRWINIQSNVTLETSLGDTLCSVFRITPFENDIARSNNSDTLKQIVIGSFDPNDKLVQPLGIGEDGRTAPDTDLFTYTIRFQNTGTDTAFRVIIIDTLDIDLDISSFEMVATSHPYTFELENRKATWTFNDILLPDSAINNEGSNGYIQYDIKPMPNAPLGSQFTNDAYIYFDFNDAVKTNTTLNTFKIALDLSIQQQLEFELFPNPMAERAFLKFENIKRDKVILEIYDQIGKLIVMHETYGNAFTIDRHQLPAGAYAFILKVGDQVGSGKLIFE